MRKAAETILTILMGITISLSVSGAGRSATIALSPDGSVLAVVNNDSRSVTLVDLPSGETYAEIIVGKDPQMISINTSGTKAFVANRFDDSISIIDLDDLRVTATIPVPDEPVGVLVSSEGLVYVSCQGADVIVVINPDQNSIVATIATQSGPRGLAFSPDESLLYVTHFATGLLSVIDTDIHVVESVVSTGLDTNLSHSISLNSAGSLAYLPQTRSNISNQALLFDTTVFPVVSVVDLDSLTHVQELRIHLDISDKPVNMPFDSALVADQTLYVLNAGSNDISVIDLATMKAVAHLEVGDNPRGLVLSPDQITLYVNNNLAGTVSVIDTGTNTISGEIKVTDIALTRSLLNGKQLFHRSDRADLSRDQWISCATCHLDGELDNRTWFFPDGMRNTPSLLGVRDTLPIHWSGDLDELQDVEITIRDIQAGTGLAQGDDNCSPACDQAPPNAGRTRDLDDMAGFMASLQFPPNPNLDDEGHRDESANRGKILFESAETGCSACHIPPLYTDHSKHDVGTGEGSGERKGSDFDVPSLRGIYKTAAYLHDGSAQTLLDVLTTRNPDDLHGKTSHLQASGLQDLVAFLESIGGESSTFMINAGLNDAWFEPGKSGQGFFIIVFPELGQLILAWFTFETERPDTSVTAQLGEPGHRWLTAQGAFAGNQAVLEVSNTTGGVFDSSEPEPSTQRIGTIIVEFSGCNAGTISYDIPSVDRQGVIPIERIVLDNVARCEALKQESQRAQELE